MYWSLRRGSYAKISIISYICTDFVKNFKMKLSIKAKLTLSLSAIAVILLISETISVLEYAKMSTYVSDLIADDISSLNTAHKLADISNKYNLDVLAVIGDDAAEIPKFDQEYFLSHCDSLRTSLESNAIQPLTDSVVYACSAYVLTSLELENVLDSPFIDSRSWYFNRLQPSFAQLSSDIDALETAIYHDLEKNSKTFERGFYRSIIPGIVAVAVGLLLVFLLLLFILAYYVTPLKKMLSSLEGYRSYNKKYTYTFDGDDELLKLNEGITELSSENLQLRKRLKDLKSKVSDELEGNQP
jgi:predicted PurR-regulated permease PerM